jgi:CxxC motif-containing protein (DUF1111 family)
MDISRKTRWLGVAILMGLGFRSEGMDAPIGGGAFVDPRNPPSYRPLDETETAQFKLGHSVFDTDWVADGAVGISGRRGLGPLFNAASCNACHSEGAHGRGPTGDGPVPVALVIQLQSPSSDTSGEPGGDPVYGHVLNTSALKPALVEAAVTVRYTETAGYYYPFGGRWTLRVPHYHLERLSYGPLSPGTIIKPRLAPALFGAGLLDAVPEAAISAGAAGAGGEKSAAAPAWHSRQGKRLLGRFGWQASAVSVRDQTTIALAREMGLTSTDRPDDDCTPAQMNCPRHPDGAAPEVPEELLSAVVAFVRALAVPESAPHPASDATGSKLFANIGCSACHRSQMTVQRPRAEGTVVSSVIAPYTDLELHDLGIELADETVSGRRVKSLWRTAPLWGLGYRVKQESYPTFLHDGRATSIEEAVLWHSGEAAYSKYRFMKLGPRARGALLHWLETL